MSKKYDEIMAKIEVTEDMRQRILQNIAKPDRLKRSNALRFPRWKSVASIAACFVMVLTGALVAPTLVRQPAAPSVQEEYPSDFLLGSGSIEECDSVEALERMVGFPVSEPFSLPFDAQETTYLSYWAEMAEIDYYGADGERAVYRKSMGTDDNSGQYAQYADIREVTVGELTVTLKGTDGMYELAWWTDGTYAYSVWLSQGAAQSEWEEMIAGQS